MINCTKNKILTFLSIAFVVCISVLLVSCKHRAKEFQAPTQKEAGWLLIKSHACFFNNADSAQKEKKIVLDNPAKREVEQIDYMMRFTGLPQNFKIYRGNINTAMATTVNNERFIVFNKNLFKALDTIDYAYWTAVFILAHEIGHHLAHTISDTSDFENAEFQADKFAGTILYNMGADSTQVLLALHPSDIRRQKAAKEGWFLGYKYRYQSMTPPPVDDEAFVKEFNENNLVFNTKWNESIAKDTLINGRDKTLDSSYGREKYLKGIIMNVTKTPVDNRNALSKGFIQLKVIILITNNNKSTQNNFKENEKYEFDVDYEPNSPSENEKGFFSFFVEGRRLEFDAVFLSFCDGCSYNISKAKAIYNSY